MAVISVYILLISFELSKVCGDAFSTYCTLPCPFMYPAQPSGSCGAIQLLPRRPSQAAKCSFCDYPDDELQLKNDDETPDPKPGPDPKSDPDPKPVVKSRQQSPPKPKLKPPAEDSKPPPEDSEPPPKKREKSSSPNSPSIQPSRRFFTSLFSIPGAVVDTLVSGEIVL